MSGRGFYSTFVGLQLRCGNDKGRRRASELFSPFVVVTVARTVGTVFPSVGGNPDQARAADFEGSQDAVKPSQQLTFQFSLSHPYKGTCLSFVFH
jgi:hypothetical protein